MASAIPYPFHGAIALKIGGSLPLDGLERLAAEARPPSLPGPAGDISTIEMALPKKKSPTSQLKLHATTI